MRTESQSSLMSLHSLSKKNTPCSNQNSHQKSMVGHLARKMSTSSLKDYVDIDKLICDIKIKPKQDNAIQSNIKTIIDSLSILKKIPSILDEVRTIQLLLQSISKKLTSESLCNTRSKCNQSNRKEPQSTHKKINSSISPIKQFQDNSRIVYTNFSLKDVQQNPIQETLFEVSSLKTPVKRYQQDKQQSEQMEKLNIQIRALEKMLKMKGVNQADIKPNTNSNINKHFASTSTSKICKQNQIVSSFKKYPARPIQSSSYKAKSTAEPKPKIYRQAEYNYR